MLNKLILAAVLASITGCSSAIDTPTSDSKIKIFNEQHYVESLIQEFIASDEYIDLDFTQFTYGKFDLNKNGNDEYIVQMIGPYFCGSGGCSTYLFDNRHNQLGYFTVASRPIAVSNQTTHDWHDLIIWSNHAYRKIEHTGKQYPSNPSVEPETTLENSITIIDNHSPVTKVLLR